MSSKPKLFRACTVSNSIGFITDMIPEFLNFYEVGIVTSPGPYWTQVEKYGNAISRYEIKMERHISPLKDLKSIIKLIRLFKREKPDIVHSMTPKAGLLCMIAGKLTCVPVRIHTFTGLVFPTSSGLKKKILMATDWMTCKCATHVIPEGEGVRKDLLDNRITKKDIKILGNGSCVGVDLDKFKISDEIIAEADKIRDKSKFTFISIGRLVKDKGINELVKAFQKLNTEFPRTRLLLVGMYENNLDPLNPETVNEIENNPNIEAVGRKNDVRPWLLASDCAVLSSYREGFPNVVLEAGAMELPQIVTDINGANEIITDGYNGLIVSPQNVDSLYLAMKNIIEDNQLRNKLASNARKRISSRYDKNFVLDCLLEYYDKILNNQV